MAAGSNRSTYPEKISLELEVGARTRVVAKREASGSLLAMLQKICTPIKVIWRSDRQNGRVEGSETSMCPRTSRFRGRHTCSATKMLIALPLLILVVRLPLGAALTDQLRAFGANATYLLDSLLSPASYNKNIRPNIGGNPVIVSVNMYIKSIGAISDNDEEYTMDLYFRQSWLDSRLKFRLHGVEEMSMSWLFVDKVWKPDTFFMNGKKSSLHKITSANKFIRLRKNGYLTLSMRLTVSASCKMHLRKFPLDTQNCSLLIGSYAYTSSDIIYKWSTEGEPVATEPGMGMAQHSLIATKIRKKFLVKRDTGEYYVIRANFIFQRSIGFFMLQVYVPCSLIICCSWVSFWINPDDVPARIQLGYGNVTPRTTLGKGFAMGYAAVGIPLMLIYLSSVGSVLAWCARSVFSRSLCCCLCSKCGYCCYDEKLMQEKERRMRIKREQKELGRLAHNQRHQEPYYVRSPSSTFTSASGISTREDKHSIEETSSKIEHRHFVAPLLLCLICMVIYIVGGGVILCRLLDKQLNYLNSIYFCFMLLTTIGYVENTFSENHLLSLKYEPGRSRHANNLAVWFCSFYIIFGMALTAMCFSIIHEEVISRLKEHYRNLLSDEGGKKGGESNLESKDGSLLTKLASGSSSNIIDGERGLLQYTMPNS